MTCDCPKMAYLGTGWEKKFRMAAVIQNRLFKQTLEKEKICFLNHPYIDAPRQKLKVQFNLKKNEEKNF